MTDLVSRAEEQLDRLRDFADRLDAIRVSHRSPDGLVTVTVDGTGAPADLELRPGIADLGGRGLAETIVTTARAAAHEALSRRAELLDELNAELSRRSAEPSPAAEPRKEGFQ